MTTETISAPSALEAEDQAQPNKKQDLKRLIGLAKPHWRGLLLGTFALTVGSSIGLLYPQAAKLSIDDVMKGGGPGGLDLTTLGLGLLALFAIQAVFVSLRYYLFTVIGDRIVADLRHQLYGAILAQEMGFFDERNTGELTSRLASDTQVLQNAVTSNVSMLLRFGAQAIGGLVLLFITSLKLSMILLLVLPIVLGVAITYGRTVRKLSKQVQDAIADSTSVAEESIAGLRTVRSFAREAFEQARYGESVERSFELAKYRSKLGALFGGAMSFVAYGALAVVLWLGSSMVMAKEMSAGELTAFLIYAFMVAMALGILSGLYTDFMKALGSSERVFTLLDRVPKLATKGSPLTEGATRGRVELKDVTFSYPTRPEVQALKAVSFSLEPGKKLALVGHSGSGKSTVASLLSRFYDIDDGEILVDGQAIERYEPTALRESIGMVAQEPVLFSGSIRSNVRYGKPSASDDEIVEAIKAANAWEFVSRFPEGLDTLIGERGVRLSGGQKQRIAIARALLKDPKILLLDEATSALDVESEQLVQRALERLMQGRTTLIIAHRLSTIRNADEVVVLDQGEVIERGTHAELMTQHGVYARMVESQQLLD